MLRPFVLVLALAAFASAQNNLEVPFPVKAGDKPIDVTVGHTAPCFVDWDGDRLPDLLVGQFGQGKLRIYRNTGKLGDPAFDAKYELFRAGGAEGTIPSG